MGLGTDPEFFILNSAGKPVPAHRFFPGKDAKMVLVDNGPGTLVKAFRDGYAIELNVPAASCRETLTHNVMLGLERAGKMIPPGHTLSTIPAVRIDLNDMLDAPEDVKTFGCDPSWNAYTGEMQSPYLDAMSHEWRYIGGHMHLSTSTTYAKVKSYIEKYPATAWFGNADRIRQFVRMCDYYIGVPLTLWFHGEEMFRRREYYGKAGEFRYQQYPPFAVNLAIDPSGDEVPANVGVEYRSPSPQMWNAPPVSSWAFGVFRWLGTNFHTMEKTWDAGLEDAVRHAVNTGDGAEALFERVCADPLNVWHHTFLPRAIKVRPFQSMLPFAAMAHNQGWEWFKPQLIKT